MDWGALIGSTLQMYRQAATETWQKITRNWWVGLLPLLYVAILSLAMAFMPPLGILGGFLLGLLYAFCISSYLYFLEGVINGERMRPQELLESWRPYFGPAITILFLLFPVQLTLSLTQPQLLESESGIPFIIQLLVLVILNAVPEIIYIARQEGLSLLQESIDFLRENWIEWFLPLVVFTLFCLVSPLPYVVTPLHVGSLAIPVLLSVAMLMGSIDGVVQSVLSAMLLFVLMTFRGLLFRALFGSSRRQRLFRSRFS
jgi:hypothetical protein